MSQWVEVIKPSTTSREATRPIRDQNVGSLRVGDENGQLIGMVTDRDIVVGAVAEDALPSNTAVRGSALPPSDA
jgi:CBS domain-containing protein